jgi:hypothetical protein
VDPSLFKRTFNFKPPPPPHLKRTVWTLDSRVLSSVVVNGDYISHFEIPSRLDGDRTSTLYYAEIHINYLRGAEQIVKNFLAFIAVFTRARHWSLSWARWIQSTPSHPISLLSNNNLALEGLTIYPVRFCSPPLHCVQNHFRTRSASYLVCVAKYALSANSFTIYDIIE